MNIMGKFEHHLADGEGRPSAARVSFEANSPGRVNSKIQPKPIEVNFIFWRMIGFALC
jgi:hypothetical protein